MIENYGEYLFVNDVARNEVSGKIISHQDSYIKEIGI